MSNKNNDFIKLLSFVSKITPTSLGPYLRIERNFNTIFLLAADPTLRKEFDSLLIKLFDNTRKFSMKYLENFFFDYYIQNDHLKLEEVLADISKIQKTQKVFYISLNDLYVDHSYKFGCFEIISEMELTNDLKSLYHKLKEEKDWENTVFKTENQFTNFFLGNNKYKNSVLKTTISAYDEYKFQELAHKKFSDFDKLLSFSCFPYAGRQIAAAIFPNHNQEEFISIDGTNFTRNNGLSEKAILITTHIQSIIEIMDKIGTAFIWDLYNNEDRNEIENRIITSALWIGMANNEEDKNVSFTEYCFALETLLQYDSGKLLSPSIGYNISETAAFIISKNYKKRKEIKTKISNLYSLRSAIVHGGKKQVTDSDLKEILTLVMLLVINLYHDKWTQYENIKKLYEKIEDIKLGDV